MEIGVSHCIVVNPTLVFSSAQALSCVRLVVLSFMATTVTARLLVNVSPSVSPSAVQETLLTDELVALQQIARALNRNLELVTNNWSWIKIGLLSFGVLLAIEILKIFTGVLKDYLVDRWRKTNRRWKSLMQENRLTASANQVAVSRAQQQSAPLATTTSDADSEENLTNSDVARGLEESFDPNLRVNQPQIDRLEIQDSTEKGKEAVIEEKGHQYCISIERLVSSRRRRQVEMATQ